MTSPDSLEELRRWTEALNRIGIGVSEEGLMNFSYKAGKIATSSRNALLKPFRPLFKITGTGQGWGLFTHPDRFPDHLEIYGKGDSGWQMIYQAFDDELDFLAPQLAYRRVRGLWDGSANKAKPSYNNFVDWVAREAFAEDPALQSIRVQFRRSRTVTPGQAPVKLNKVRQRRVRHREDMK
jgi:hypothetical protein